MADNKKTCILCQTAFYKGNASNNQWGKRKYCSPVCAQRARVGEPYKDLGLYPEPTETKKCGMCQQVYTRQRGTSPTVWLTRKFCSKACGYASRERHD